MTINCEVLRNYLEEKMGVDVSELEDETPLFSSNLLDSFSMIDMIMFFEKKTGIKLEESEITLDNFDSISKILSLLATKQMD